MNQQMWESEDTAKSCELLSRKMNEHLKFYKSHLESFKKQFIELESLKFDSLFESIRGMNRYVVEATCCRIEVVGLRANNICICVGNK